MAALLSELNGADRAPTVKVISLSDDNGRDDSLVMISEVPTAARQVVAALRPTRVQLHVKLSRSAGQISPRRDCTPGTGDKKIDILPRDLPYKYDRIIRSVTVSPENKTLSTHSQCYHKVSQLAETKENSPKE